MFPFCETNLRFVDSFDPVIIGYPVGICGEGSVSFGVSIGFEFSGSISGVSVMARRLSVDIKMGLLISSVV